LSSDPNFSGNYPIETRDGEIERLYIQGAAMAPDATTMLDRIGVASGWHCLDFGCGPGGITELMSERVGPAGRVVGLDMNARFLDHARKSAPANVEFINGDAYHASLPERGFDLVHMRFVASTAGGPELLIREAMRLTRPGGFVALQDPDMGALNCYPPNPAWEALKTALQGAFTSVGADINLAQRTYALMRRAGLEDVQYRPFIIGVRSNDPMRDYLPATVESLRGTILGNKLMTAAALEAALAHCRAHIRDPDTAFTMYIVAQVWGRVPKL
jgi:ubiquinone/menaquinone biosynthesis C-methylase UbiE